MAVAVPVVNVHKLVRSALTVHARFRACQVVSVSNAVTMGAAVRAVFVLEMGCARISLVAATPTVTTEFAAMMAVVDHVVNVRLDKYARKRLVSVKHNAFPNVLVNSVVPMGAVVHVVNVQTIPCVEIRFVCRQIRAFQTVQAKYAEIMDVVECAENVMKA